MGSILLAYIAIIRLCASNRPDMVQARKDLEDYYEWQIKKPFMDKWNGVPSNKPPIKFMSPAKLLLTLAIAGISTYAFLWIWAQFIPGR